jgi:hypothetical protein
MEGSAELSQPITEAGRIQAPFAWFGRACGGDTVNGNVAGKIVLIERGGCDFSQKLSAAQQFGAVGALVYNDETGLATMGATGGVPQVPFPAFMILQADGQRLRQQLEGGATMEAVLDPVLKGTVAQDALSDTISDFSSRGPSRNGEFKPNIAAPGSHIFAPRMGSGDQGVAYDGTSMATPMVAGAAAVIVQRLRDQGLAPVDKPLGDTSKMTVSDVGAFLMDYAHADVWRADNRTQEFVPLARSGAGRVDLSRAARGTTLVKAGTMAAINLGILAFDDTFNREEPVTLRNLSEQQRKYGLAVQFRDPTKVNSGVKYTMLAGGNAVPRVTVSGKSAVTLKLKVEAFANQLRHYPIFGGLSAMNGDGRMAQAEYDAFIVITELDANNQPLAGGDVVHLPVYFLPRGTSVIEAAPSPIRVSSATGQGPVVISNDGGQPGRADLFALWAEDPIEGEVNTAMNIDQLGIRSGQDGDRQRIVEFAAHFVGARTTPLDSTVNIFIDNDSDAAMDWRIFNLDLGAVTRGRYNGQQAVGALDIAGNTIYLRYLTNTDINSRSVTLPVLASWLGVTGDAPLKFNAVVVNSPTFDHVPLDIIPDGSYDEQNGTFGTDRLEFDQEGLAFTLDRWSMEVAAGGATVANVRTQGTSGVNILDRILALYPQNLQRRNDSQILAIEPGELPTLVPTPLPQVTDTPTSPPTPTWTPGPTNTPRITPTPGSTRPVIPTDTPTATGRSMIYLPVTKKE